MNVILQRRVLDCDFPPSQPPSWQSQVDRWNQLDAPAFGLAEISAKMGAQMGSPPDLIILASPRASNSTDHLFARSGSPSKFVHTLPNVRGGALLQAMQWSGPCLCLQNDPSTEISGLAEAAGLLIHNPEFANIWIASVRSLSEMRHRISLYQAASQFALSVSRTAQSLVDEAMNFQLRATTPSAPSGDDRDWQQWIDDAKTSTEFQISPFYRAVRSGRERQR